MHMIIFNLDLFDHPLSHELIKTLYSSTSFIHYEMY